MIFNALILLLAGLALLTATIIVLMASALWLTDWIEARRDVRKLRRLQQ